MADFMFHKESPPEIFENVGGINDWKNVCVVGLDGKGWTSGSLLTSVSPWMKDLMASIPPDSGSCIILPDITWKQISGFFKLTWEASHDLVDLLKIPASDGDHSKDVSKCENMDEQMLAVQKLGVDECQETVKSDPNTSLNQCREIIEFQEESSSDFKKTVALQKESSYDCVKEENVQKKSSSDFVKQKIVKKDSPSKCIKEEEVQKESFTEFVMQEQSLGNYISEKDFQKRFSSYCMKQEDSSITTAALETSKPSVGKEHEIKCEMCDLLFSSKYKLSEHKNMLGHTNPKKPFKHRNKTKYSRRTLHRILKSANIGSYNLDQIEGLILSPCDKCDKKCISPKSLQIHKDKIHPVLHSCDYCEFSTNSKVSLVQAERQLRLHIRSTHGDVPIFFSCNMCDKKYENRNALGRHKLTDHDGIRYPCDQCDYKAKDRTYLKLHLNSVHEKITISCEKCDKVYTNPRNLYQHQLSVHEGIFYLCDQCDYKGTQKRNLQGHIEKVHEGIFYPCDQCAYKGPNKRKLRVHIKTRHNDKQYIAN